MTFTADAIERMRADGFESAVVVETSPNNFQAWLNHGQLLDRDRVRDGGAMADAKRPDGAS